MAALQAKFNSGELTSDTIDRQFTDEFVTKAVVELPERKKIFSVRSNRITMPKNHGTKLSREVDYGMLDERNLVDGNVDATVATLIQDVWYHVSAAGTVIATFDAKTYLKTNGGDLVSARAAAKTAAEAAVAAGAATDELRSGSGGIVNGKALYAATRGPIAELPESGGVLNLLSHTSKMVSTNLTFHGIAHKFTMRSVDLDSRQGLIARKIKHLSNAVSDIKEMQVRNDLIAAGHNNMIISVGSTNAGTITKAEIDGTDVLTYETLEAWEQDLIENDVPMDTEILTGTDLVDTKVVSDAYIVYVHPKVLPTLRSMTGPGGALVWKPKESYAAGLPGGAAGLMEGEQGAIGSFRFVTVKDMEIEFGAGDEVGGVNDAAAAGVQATAYKTLDADTKYYYDVYTALIVGDDSFSIAGYGSNNTSASYLPPVKDVHNDMYGENAGVSAKWSYGMLVYRPERIRSVCFSVQKNG